VIWGDSLNSPHETSGLSQCYGIEQKRFQWVYWPTTETAVWVALPTIISTKQNLPKLIFAVCSTASAVLYASQANYRRFSIPGLVSIGMTALLSWPNAHSVGGDNSACRWLGRYRNQLLWMTRQFFHIVGSLRVLNKYLKPPKSLVAAVLLKVIF